MSRRQWIIGGFAGTLVAGAALYLTAPPTNLVDAPAYPQSQQLLDSFNSTITPKLSSFYDEAGWTPGPPANWSAPNRSQTPRKASRCTGSSTSRPTCRTTRSRCPDFTQPLTRLPRRADSRWSGSRTARRESGACVGSVRPRSNPRPRAMAAPGSRTCSHLSSRGGRWSPRTTPGWVCPDLRRTWSAHSRDAASSTRCVR